MFMGLSRRKRTKKRRKKTEAKADWARPLATAAVFGMARALDLKVEARARTPRRPQNGWPFWKAILIRVYEQTSADRVLALAAGVVFYGLFALFPAITALVSSYALFANASTIGEHLSSL